MNVDFTLAGAVIFTGLVVVFTALIGLSLVVWLIGKLFAAIANKPKTPTAQPVPPTARPAALQNIAPVVEDGIGDEIIAVIAAAVAAMGDSAGGFALRSVTRVRESRSAWAQAGVLQNTQPF